MIPFLLGLIVGVMVGCVVVGMLSASAERERQAERMLSERRKRAGKVLR